jgi:hypothetical protein
MGPRKVTEVTMRQCSIDLCVCVCVCICMCVYVCVYIHTYKNMQFQSSIVDNGRDYVLHYVGMSNMQFFYFFCL